MAIAWGFRSIAADTPSPTELGLRLLRQLPKILTQRFEVLVLADTALVVMILSLKSVSLNTMSL
jgi:hypothetical protein